ncbi:MAG: hypothetical protein K2X35_01825 [Bryobacteraceae bacterium]|nr:hypothetical protein [Bryobacteraceae bacterium]
MIGPTTGALEYTGGTKPAYGVRAAAARTETTTGLTVTTAEGDRVTLSFESRSDAGLYDIRAGGARASGQFQSARLEAEVKVEGSLNAREIADLGRLLRMVGKAARKLEGPDPSQALAAFRNFSRLASLAAANIEYSRTEESAAALLSTGQSAAA